MGPRPVFVARGDRLSELESLIEELGGPAAAGLHRQMHVTRADQTVAITEAPDSPLAAALRTRPDWAEPREP